MKKNGLLYFFLLCMLFSRLHAQETKVWTAEQANAWYAAQPWFVGANFLPSSAINQLEMWQAESFDVETIDKELSWASAIGMNIMRVYLHDLAWQTDPQGFKKRMGKFLEIASKHKIKILFTLFDDCWNPEAFPGKQPPPKPGIHNSGWVIHSDGDYCKHTLRMFYPVLQTINGSSCGICTMNLGTAGTD